MLKSLVFFAVIQVFFSITAHALPGNITIPLTLNQNALDYVSTPKLNTSVLSANEAKAQKQYFLQQYFYPWSKLENQQVFFYVPGVQQTSNNVLKLEKGTLAYYKNKIGFGNHYQPYKSGWTAPISSNMDLSHFPNVSCTTSGCRGIIVRNAQLRSLPVSEPFYKDFTTTGDGSPFDYIQLAHLWIGTPIMMIQTTRDGKWTLVNSQGSLGWIQTSHLAKVDEKFIRQWKKSDFVTPATLKQTVFIPGQCKSVEIEQGSLLPIKKNHILIPYRDSQGNAKIVTIKQSNVYVAKWPLLPTYKNIGMIINQLINIPYGWGGKNSNDDCSSLMQRLFTTFGIWLPRSSTLQTFYGGTNYSLSGRSKMQKKLWLINKHGPVRLIPFLTLVSFGSNEKSTTHVGLYLGTTIYNQQKFAVMFNAPWGIHMKSTDGKNTGIALVAHSLISPVGLGDIDEKGLKLKGWNLMSLWEKPGFNVILLNKPPAFNRPYSNQQFIQKSQPDKVKQYLHWY